MTPQFSPHAQLLFQDILLTIEEKLSYPGHVFPRLTRLSTFASFFHSSEFQITRLHYTAFRDAIREDSRQTTPSRGVTPRKKFAIEVNVESRLRGSFLAANRLTHMRSTLRWG